MRTPEDILACYRERAREMGPAHAAMRQINAIYHGQARIPLPDLDTDNPPGVPNLLAQGIDQMAGRIASVTPMALFSPQRPGIRTSERRAETARRAVTGWWQDDRLPVKMKQRARHLIAYGIAPVTIRWDPTRHRPTWDVRDPLTTYPAPDVLPGSYTPADCLFAYRRSVAWLRRMGYGDAVARLYPRGEASPTTRLLLLEYHDEDGSCLCLTNSAGVDQSFAGVDVSASIAYAGDPIASEPGRCVALETAWNGVMGAVIPSRITLERATGQFDTMIGMYYQQAKLMALEVMAVEKGIFPDTYLISRPGEMARFLDGPHDGRTGKVNVVAGGDVREINPQPGYLTNPTMDRLERNQRITAGIPAEFGGESQTNVRTGRRGDAIMSAVIDFPVAEAQEVFASALVEEDMAGINLAKKIDGDNTRTFYVGTGNAARPVTYQANKVFDPADHTVSYPVTGADVNSLMIGLGQRIGMGIMSKETAATLDPFIDAPEVEHDRIIAEGLEQSLVAGIQQQAAGGQIPPATVAKIMSLVASDKMELADAITKAIEDAQAEAAAQAQAQPATPEAAMAGPTAASLTGNPEAASPIPGASQGQESLSGLLSSLRMPAMGIKPNVGVGGRV